MGIVGAGEAGAILARELHAQPGVALAPAVTFRPAGEGYVRFRLIESDARLREAASRIGAFLHANGA